MYSMMKVENLKQKLKMNDNGDVNDSKLFLKEKKPCILERAFL